MLTRKNKEELATEYKELFSKMSVGIFLDYKSLKANEITKLRKSLQSNNSYLKVLKNRVAKWAVKETNFENIAEELSQTRALIYSEDGDLVSMAKIACKQIEELEKCQLISGFVLEKDELKLLSEKEVIAFSKLASRTELLGKLLYLLNYPVTGLARTLNEIPTKFVRLLKMVSENKK